jgi:hypothetical protein
MIAIITDQGIGGTFFTWSIYYLSGKTQYFSASSRSTIALPMQPLLDKNAHGFVANHPVNKQEFEEFFPLLVNTDECVYMHNFRGNTKEFIDRLCNSATKVIVISLHSDQMLYQCGYTPRAPNVPAWDSNKRLVDPDDIYEDFTDHFFKESKQQWEKENLNEIWDKREFIALNFDPFDKDSILNYISNNLHRYTVNSLDLWLNFDQHIPDLFRYLDIALDQNRWLEWLPIYKLWQHKHTKRLQFAQNFESIVNGILLGHDVDLTKFDLDIQQEAAIQHQMIYKYNLNFKTWQLTKFTNTKQLHDLLEPNIHNLTNSLIKRLATQVY